MRSQHVGDPDERQADDGGRIDALHACEQGDAESFAFEAAGAIERGLRRDVSLDLRSQKLAEHAARVVHVLRPQARLDADDGDRRVKGHGVTGEAAELGDLCRGVTGFAERLIAEGANLIRADHECAGFAFGDRAGFGECEACGERARRLARQRGFVDLG